MGLKASKFIGGNSDFIKADDVKDAPLKVTIENVEPVELGGKTKLQIIVKGGKKITLNTANTSALIGAFGDDCDAWIGKSAVAFFDPNIMYGTKRVGGLRLKVGAQKPAPVVGGDDDDLGF